MKELTINEMRSINGSSICVELVLLAIDLGLIGVM